MDVVPKARVKSTFCPKRRQYNGIFYLSPLLKTSDPYSDRNVGVLFTGLYLTEDRGREDFV